MFLYIHISFPSLLLYLNTGPHHLLQSFLQQLPNSLCFQCALLYSVFHTAAWAIFLVSKSEHAIPKFSTDGETKQKHHHQQQNLQTNFKALNLQLNSWACHIRYSMIWSLSTWVKPSHCVPPCASYTQPFRTKNGTGHSLNTSALLMLLGFCAPIVLLSCPQNISSFTAFPFWMPIILVKFFLKNNMSWYSSIGSVKVELWISLLMSLWLLSLWSQDGCRSFKR